MAEALRLSLADRAWIGDPAWFPALNPPPRDDVFGSLASVAVEPGTFTLQGAADARLPEATATVVSR
jgi:hypothetical protein